jgi:hypothetical protein
MRFAAVLPPWAARFCSRVAGDEAALQHEREVVGAGVADRRLRFAQ